MRRRMSTTGADEIVAIFTRGPSAAPIRAAPLTTTSRRRSALDRNRAARSSGSPMWRPSGPTLPLNVSAVGMATSIDGKSSFHPSAHQSRSNGPVSPTTDPSIRVTPAFAICSASASSASGASSGSPCPTSQRSPSITPSTGAADAIARVAITRSGPTACRSAIERSSFSFDAGGRVTQPRCPYHSAPSSPIVTDIRRSPISPSIRALPRRLRAPRAERDACRIGGACGAAVAASAVTGTAGDHAGHQEGGEEHDGRARSDDGTRLVRRRSGCATCPARAPAPQRASRCAPRASSAAPSGRAAWRRSSPGPGRS